MKRKGFIFIAECIVIMALLLGIGFLLKGEDSKKTAVNREEMDNSVIAVEKMTNSKIETVSIEEIMQEDDASQSMESNEQIPREPTKVELEESEQSEQKETAQMEDTVNIVVFGDSIWDAGRGTDGISEQVMEACDVRIYNCAIGGTTAAMLSGGSTQWDQWTSQSFNGMMYIANGAIEADDLIQDTEACEVIKTVDFDQIDYVIVSYGLNDYFFDVPIYPQEYYDVTSFVGALRHGITKLQEEHPNLEIIITSPTYCEWFAGERQFNLGTYVENARGVAAELDVHFLDMYHALGKNPEQKMQYLEDGVHLTKEGRTVYANSVVSLLEELEKAEDTEE